MSSTDKPTDSSPESPSDPSSVDQVNDQSSELSAAKPDESAPSADSDLKSAVKKPTDRVKSKSRAPETTKTGSPFISSLLMLVILSVLGAAGAGYYYWQQLQVTLSALNAQVEQQAMQLSGLQDQLSRASTNNQNNSQAIELLAKELNLKSQSISDLTEAQQTLLNTSRNVFNLTHRNQRQWILAEASYLLSLANQRLIIVSDIDTAVAALTGASHRLHDLADPSLLSLRKQIATEIAALKMIQQPDINGLALALDNMTQLIEQLPFKSARQALEESTAQSSETISLPASDEQSMFSSLWQRLSQLVTIRKHNLEIKPTETVTDKTTISQQIHYRLATARLALINKNTAVFNHEISRALELLNFYYDMADNRVQTLSDELTAYSTLSLTPVLPDISRSWQILQQIIATIEANNTLQPNDVRTVK